MTASTCVDQSKAAGQVCRRTEAFPAIDWRTPKVGDVIATAGHELVSAGISLGTLGIPFWTPSHVGLVGQWRGELYIVHCTSDKDMPCEITGRPIYGVQAQKLETFRTFYRGRIWHYPLYYPLYDDEWQRLNDSLFADLGKSYDRRGACHAGGGFVFQAIQRLWREESLAFVFCSEWVASKQTYAGLLCDTNASLWNPATLIRYERLKGLLRRPNRWK